MQRQGCHRTLVTDVENNLIVDVHTVMIPLNLSRQLGIIALWQHEQTAIRTQGVVLQIEILVAGISKLQSTFVMPIDVTEIS